MPFRCVLDVRTRRASSACMSPTWCAPTPCSRCCPGDGQNTGVMDWNARHGLKAHTTTSTHPPKLSPPRHPPQMDHTTRRSHGQVQGCGRPRRATSRVRPAVEPRGALLHRGHAQHRKVRSVWGRASPPATIALDPCPPSLPRCAGLIRDVSGYTATLPSRCEMASQ
jgi:hypothetical protein